MPVKILTFRIFTKSGAATLRNRRRKSACSSFVSKGAKKHNAPHGKPHRALLSGEPVEALQGAAQCNTAKLCCMAAAKQLLGGYDVDQTALNVDHLLDALAC